MEDGPSAKTYHAEARPDNIQSPSGIRRGNKSCRMWRICTIAVEYLHSANGSRVKGGRYSDIARGLHNTKVVWAQQIVQPVQLTILYGGQHGFFCSLYLLVYSIVLGGYIKDGGEVFNT